MNATICTCPRCGGALKPREKTFGDYIISKGVLIGTMLLSALVLYGVASVLSLSWLNDRAIMSIGGVCGLIAWILYDYRIDRELSCAACGWEGNLPEDKRSPVAHLIGKQIGRLFRKTKVDRSLPP